MAEIKDKLVTVEGLNVLRIYNEDRYANKEEMTSPFNFKGKCIYANLPSTGNTINDTWYCTDKKCRYSWNGNIWEQSSMDESDYADELAAVKTIEVGTTAPVTENVELWVNPENKEEFTVPEINDKDTSTEDTWSSIKINNEIDGIKKDLGELDNAIFNTKSKLDILSSVVYKQNTYTKNIRDLELLKKVAF